MTPRNAFILVLAVGTLWAVGDQWTKYLAVRDLTHLIPEEAGRVERVKLFYTTHDLRRIARPPVEVVPGVWNHIYVQNPAGAFGLFSGISDGPRKALFTVVALLASAGILLMAWHSHGAGMLPTQLALALVFGGAIGNLLDRIVHGYVIDFIDWYVTIGGVPRHWPAFNLADVGIVVGVIGLLALNFVRAPLQEVSESPAPAKKRAETS